MTSALHWNMECILCEKSIDGYDAAFHHLNIDEHHAVDICPECVDKFVKWHGKQIALLFPTSALKKRYCNNK